MTYTDTCDTCEREISAAARFCPRCGARQEWFTDDCGHRHDPGAEVRDAYRRMFVRAQAADEDPREPESFEHALRMVVPAAHVDVIEEVGDERPLPRDPAKRAKVPSELSLSIREAVEDAFENPPPEQATLSFATDGGKPRTLHTDTDHSVAGAPGGNEGGDLE